MLYERLPPDLGVGWIDWIISHYRISPSVGPVRVIRRVGRNRIRVLGNRVAVVSVLEKRVPRAATTRARNHARTYAAEREQV